jgi:hypothetical protein
MSTRYTPEPSQIDYHEAQQAQRVARAKPLIDPGDVLSILDSRLAQEPDPRAHPLYPPGAILPRSRNRGRWRRLL